tara:strand:- start:133 stop:1512 length:1380 start_codon:yes stop_codon:yes gene_type:complete
MEIKVSTLKSQIITDNPELLKALRELYSFKIPGSEYSPAYKRGGWDGKQHFITNTGKFPTGLLSRVLADLKKIECEPEVEYDHSITSEWYHHELITIDRFKYYDYQENLINQALDKKRGIIKSPTGSGKTLIMAGILKALSGRKTVVLFNAKQLLTQTYEFLTEDCKMKNIGICYGEGFVYGDVMLCTIQSLEKILDTHLKQSEVLLVDECHEFSKGRTTLAAINSFPKAVYRLGFTATTPSERIPKYNLEGAFGPVIEVANTADLVEKGKLTRPIIQLVDRPYDCSGLDENMSYEEVYDTYIVNNTTRNDIIKNIVYEITKKQSARILILTKSLAHGRILEDLLKEFVRCSFIEGANSIGERYKAISEFRRESSASVIIGTRVLQTGVNIKEITHLINARGLKGEIATLQALGRALRKFEGKDNAYIYDFLDKEKYLKNHANQRKKHYQKEGHEVRIL